MVANVLSTIYDVNEIIKNKNWRIRKRAVKKTEDQSLLAQIAKNDDNIEVRKVAIKKVIDPDVLYWIAKNDRYIVMQKIALKKLSVLKSKNQMTGSAKKDKKNNFKSIIKRILDKIKKIKRIDIT